MQYRDVFRQPHLVWLWLSQITSAIGDQLYTVAVIWIAVERGNGAAGYVAAAGTFVGLFLNPVAGVLADRWDKRSTMVAVDLLRAVIVLGLAIVGQFTTLTLVHLAIATILVSGLGCLFDPCMGASLPEFAGNKLETLKGMNALMQLNRQFARTIGPGAAGWLATMLPIHQFFALDSVSFVLSAAVIFSLVKNVSGEKINSETAEALTDMHIADAVSSVSLVEAGINSGTTSGVYPVVNQSSAKQRSIPEVRNVFAEMSNGISLVLSHIHLKWLFGFAALANIAYGPAVIVGFPLWAKQLPHSGLATYGILVAFYGAGGFLNIVVSMFKTHQFMFWYCFGWLVFGSGLFIIGRSSDLPLACLGATIAPIGGAFIGLMTSLVIQTDIPREHLGKIFSLAAFAVCLGDFLGLLLAPILYSMVDARDGISISAVLPAMLGILGMIKFRQRK
jgi:MFS family permease